MPYLFFAWYASIAFGFAVIIGKLTAKYAIKNVWLFNFFYSGFVMLFTLPVALVAGVHLPPFSINLVCAGFTLALGILLYSYCLYSLDVSVLSPLFNFRTAFSVLLGIILLGEMLSTRQYILVGIIFLGGFIASFDEHLKLRAFFKPAVIAAISATMVWSLNGVFLQKAIADSDFWSATLFSLLISQAFLLTTIPKFYRELPAITSKQWGTLVGLAAIDVTATLASFKAFEKNVSLSSVIISIPFSFLFTMTLVFFKPALLEKHPWEVYAIRIVTTIIIVAAALLL